MMRGGGRWDSPSEGQAKDSVGVGRQPEMGPGKDQKKAHRLAQRERITLVSGNCSPQLCLTIVVCLLIPKGLVLVLLEVTI